MSHTNFNQIKSLIENQSLSLVYLNIRSLRTNFNNLLTNIKNILNNIDLIVLVETNINDHESDFYKITGFNAAFVNRINRKGGGIAVYVKDNIDFNSKKMNGHTYEGLELTLKVKERAYTVIALYRPPVMTKAKAFINEFDELLQKHDKQKNIIAVGDINIDLLKQSNTVNYYLNALSSNGLPICNMMVPTRVDVSRNTKTNIDHLLVKGSNAEIKTGVVMTNFSDHYGLYLTSNYTNSKYVVKTISEKTSYISNKKVDAEIKSTNWDFNNRRVLFGTTFKLIA